MTRLPYILAGLLAYTAFGAQTAHANNQATPPPAEIACASSPFKKWFPEDMGDLRGMVTLCRTAYAARFNPQTRNPDWVVEILNANTLKGTADRDKSNFAEDPDLVARNVTSRATLWDYKGSSFDRGHQAPAGDMKRSQPVMDESFYLTNMAPQVGIGFNRGAWRKLETVVRDWAIDRPDRNFIVVTGPVYDPEEPLRFMVHNLGKQGEAPTRVRIPDAFYKIVYDTRKRRTIAFLMPNEKTPYHSYKDRRVTIREIEDKTGYNFFSHWSERFSRLREDTVANLWR